MDALGAARSAGVIVIGAGQAGLSVSHELSRAGVDHVILEQSRIAQSWRDRWDSFTLVTPNWTIRLPGGAYAGDDPDGYLSRAEIVACLERYAEGFAAPVFDGVSVTGLGPGAAGSLALQTSAGEIAARVVVVCTGAFQKPHRPPALAELPASIRVMDSGDYRNPSDLAPGRIVIVGSGQTGCQLAEELQLAGRDVILSCGRAPWVPRRLGGEDVFTWLDRVGFFDVPLAALPSPAARLVANPQATGRGGGHDLHVRTLQALGVQVTGRLRAVSGGRLRFADDLAASVAFGDTAYAELRKLMAARLPLKGFATPEMPEPPPFRADAVESVPTGEVSTVICTSGFRPDYARWISLPVFDEMGFPLTTDGASEIPGLYFCGVHFLRNRKSSILLGIGEDASIVAASVTRFARSGIPTR